MMHSYSNKLNGDRAPSYSPGDEARRIPANVAKPPGHAWLRGHTESFLGPAEVRRARE
jgi:hypothetical protein